MSLRLVTANNEPSRYCSSHIHKKYGNSTSALHGYISITTLIALSIPISRRNGDKRVSLDIEHDRQQGAFKTCCLLLLLPVAMLSTTHERGHIVSQELSKNKIRFLSDLSCWTGSYLWTHKLIKCIPITEKVL